MNFLIKENKGTEFSWPFKVLPKLSGQRNLVGVLFEFLEKEEKLFDSLAAVGLHYKQEKIICNVLP